jgi:Tol biopolymer transport system component
VKRLALVALLLAACSGGDDEAPLAPAANGDIVFASKRDGNESRDVYVMNVDGGDVRRLTENNAAERNPTWLRDGRIVFWRCSGGVFGCSLIATSAETGATSAGSRTLPRTTCSPPGRPTARRSSLRGSQTTRTTTSYS